MGVFVSDIEQLEKFTETYRQLQGNPQIFRDFTLDAVPVEGKAIHFVSEFRVSQQPALEIWIDPGLSCYDRIHCHFLNGPEIESAHSIAHACEQAFERFHDRIAYSCFYGASVFFPQEPYIYDWFDIYRALREKGMLLKNSRDLLWNGKMFAESIPGPCVFAVKDDRAVFIANTPEKQFLAFKCRNFSSLLFLGWEGEGAWRIDRLPRDPNRRMNAILDAVEKTVPLESLPPMRIMRDITHDGKKFVHSPAPSEEEGPPETASGGPSPHPAT